MKKILRASLESTRVVRAKTFVERGEALPTVSELLGEHRFVYRHRLLAADHGHAGQLPHRIGAAEPLDDGGEIIV